LYTKIQERSAHLAAIAPVSVDLSYNAAVPIVGQFGTDPHFPASPANNLSVFNERNNQLEKFYRDSFVNVVTESRFAQPTANYSEKTFQAILYHKPFIMVAPPKTLQYLREEGYRTFGDFWDESYDQCMNHEDRLTKIYQLIDWIDAKSIDELRQMYRDMKDIMEHNFRILAGKKEK
jgi:hypothetical protein